MSVNFFRIILLSIALVALTGCKLFEYGNDDEDTDQTPEDPQGPVIGPLDKLFGTAPGDEGDYDAVLTYFNQLTPENQGKWGEVEATRDVMDWEDLDFAHTFAQNNGLSYKHHVLIWGQQQPAWIDALGPTEQLEEIEEWMVAVAARYPGLEFVEVVNEPLHSPPSYKDALGGDGDTGYDWVIAAFEMAREHFPNAQLLLNDYQILHLEQNTAEYLALIQLLQDRDLIDAIGLEAHFLEQTAPAMVQINLDTLAGTGLPIYITEFDLNLDDDALHANVMSKLFPVFWEHPAVAGVTHWGHREGSMWQANAFLINADGTERPALEWLVCYLNGETDCTVPELVFDGWQGTEAGLVWEAESYDEGEGIVAVGEVVAYTNGGDWIAFKGVEFQAGWDTLEVRYSKGVDDGFPATITVHLGGLDNPMQAEVDLPPTGAWSTFNTVQVPWPARTDTQDVYISFNADEAAEAVANLDKVSFLKPVSDDADNLVTDGGFEGLAVDGGWSTFGNATATLNLSTAQAHTGSQSMIVENRTGTGGFAAYNLTSAVTAGNIYAVSAQVYQDGAAADTVRLAAKIGCASGDSYPWLENNAAVAPDTWTELSGNLDIPSDCDIVDVVIYFEGTAAATTVYLDEVEVLPPEEVDDGNVVIDGGFEGAAVDGGWQSWNGSTLNPSTVQTFAGSQSLLATNRPDTNQFAVYSLMGKVTADTTYAVSAQVYQDGAAADTVRLAAKVECTPETVPGGHNTFPWLDNDGAVPNGVWTELSSNLVIPDCDLVDVALIFEGTAAGVDVYIDEVKVLPPSGGGGGSNLLTNGDFESGDTAPWHSLGGGSILSATTDQAHEGTYSMLATDLPASGGYAAYNVTALVADDTDYTVSARVRHNGAANDGIRLAARVTCATPPEGHNEFPWLQDNQDIAPDTWTQLSGTLQIPAACGPQEVQIYFEGDTDQSSNVYIDAVSVVAQ